MISEFLTKEHENKIFKKNDKNSEKNKELNINKLISKNLRYYNKNIYIFQKQKNDLFNDNDSLKENNIISRPNLRTNLSINIEDLNQRQFKKYMTNPKNTVNTSINNHNKKSKNIKNLPNNEEKINSGNINIKKINIIDSDNELYFSESNRINNIKTKQFPTLLANLFSIKLIKNRLTLNKNSKNYIDSENKFTKKINDNIIHNYSSLNTNIYDSKLNNVNDSSNVSIIKSSETLNIKYGKLLLLLAKKGNEKKFLQFFQKIRTLKEKILININYQDEKGNTALHYACDEGNLKIVEILLNANCNTNIKNNLNKTPLHLSTQKGYFNITKKLIEFGAILNIEDSEKNTPLHFICKNNYIKLLKYILLKSPKINCKNINGKTPSDLTTNLEIKKLLDDYIKQKVNNSNYSKISKVTKEIKTAMNKELKINRIKKDINSIIGKNTNKRSIIFLKRQKYSNDQSKNEINSINEKTPITNKINQTILNYSSKKRINLEHSYTNPYSKKDYNKNIKINKDNELKFINNTYNSEHIIKNNNKGIIKFKNIYIQNKNNINNNININIYSINKRNKNVF